MIIYGTTCRIHAQSRWSPAGFLELAPPVVTIRVWAAARELASGSEGGGDHQGVEFMLGFDMVLILFLYGFD